MKRKQIVSYLCVLAVGIFLGAALALVCVKVSGGGGGGSASSMAASSGLLSSGGWASSEGSSSMESSQAPDSSGTLSSEEASQASSSQAVSEAETLGAVTWEAATAYTGGQKVIYEGGLYKAKWWTQGDKPARSGDTVWEYLGDLPSSSAESKAASSAAGTSKPASSALPPASSKPSGGSGQAAPSGFKVVAYVPSWRDGSLEKLDFNIVTHVNYAFAIPTAEGGLRPLENPELAKKVISAAHKSGAKVLLSVGGWSYNDSVLEPVFDQATATDEKLKKFGDAMIAMCDTYGFDGVDVDWEHPRVDTTKARYEKLMLYLADRLHKNGKFLTAAVLSGATPDGTILYDSAAHTDKVLNAVDWINIMAYDGGDGERHSTYAFAQACGKYWQGTRGLSPSKVNLGMPFYGRPSWASYGDILAADPSADTKDKTTYNGMEAWYNGTATIRKKTAYARDNLGGVMIWEIAQDTSIKEKSLLQAIGKELGKVS